MLGSVKVFADKTNADLNKRTYIYTSPYSHPFYESTWVVSHVLTLPP